ncbi:MAG: hypothetical protein LBJ16_01710 [Holosporaceae bacterium]|nr:hypothetical protein [Holosporaceae bacterium]
MVHEDPSTEATQKLPKERMFRKKSILRQSQGPRLLLYSSLSAIQEKAEFSPFPQRRLRIYNTGKSIPTTPTLPFPTFPHFFHNLCTLPRSSRRGHSHLLTLEVVVLPNPRVAPVSTVGVAVVVVVVTGATRLGTVAIDVGATDVVGATFAGTAA